MTLTEPAILYARYSMDPIESAVGDRAELPESESCEVQIERCNAYLPMAHLTDGHTIRDPATSAVRLPLASRPGGAELLRLLEERKARHVVIQRVDRMFRDAGEALNQAKAWAKKKITLHLADQGGCSVRYDTPMGRWFFGQLALQAEFEPAMTAERTSCAMRHHQRNGRRMSSQLVYGQMYDPESKVNRKGIPLRTIVNPVEQAIIEQMKQWRHQGHGWRTIARMLTEQCDGTKVRFPRSHQAVKKILLREGVS